MLSQIKLKNFKCFRELTEIPVGKLNLLTGINGKGKSSVFQSLLLMRQSAEHSRTTNKIILNGNCIALGNFSDAKNYKISQDETIVFGFSFQKNDNHVDLHYILRENIDDEMVVDIEKLTLKGVLDKRTMHFEIMDGEIMDGESGILEVYDEIPDNTDWNNLLPHFFYSLQYDEFIFIKENINFKKIHYVSADRIGPQDYYAKQSLGDFPNVGKKGEYTANILSKKKGDSVYRQICLESGDTDTVLDQTEAWLRMIFGGGKINIQSVDANIILMQMNSENSSNLYRPVNIGFGYSYVLPIIVSGLIAKQGEMLIVENPEAHLHPYAQSQLVKFLAKVSNCGVQVFIESHSDHILNAARVAALDEIVSHEDLNILYFKNTDDKQIIQIPVQPDGSIENWPAGFFDQTDKDFERLFGI